MWPLTWQPSSERAAREPLERRDSLPSLLSASIRHANRYGDTFIELAFALTSALVVRERRPSQRSAPLERRVPCPVRVPDGG